MNSLYQKFKNLNKDELNNALLISCRCGNLEEVKYLLISSELTEHADIQSYSYASLNLACSQGHLEVVQYLLTSPELKIHANLHANSEDFIHTPFVNALGSGQLPIVYYFIFELNIEKQKYIDKYFRYFPNENIENLFEIRELKQNNEQDIGRKFKL